MRKREPRKSKPELETRLNRFSVQICSLWLYVDTLDSIDLILFDSRFTSIDRQIVQQSDYVHSVLICCVAFITFAHFSRSTHEMSFASSSQVNDMRIECSDDEEKTGVCFSLFKDWILKKANAFRWIKPW